MRFFAAICLVCIFATGASAHTSGFTFEAKAEGYFIDVGYDNEAPAPGIPVRFDFSLTTDGENGYPKDVPFESVWVRIEQGDSRTVFATGVTVPEFGIPTLLYAFPLSGSYTIFIRFEGEDSSLAEAEMPFTVSPSPEPFITTRAGLFLLGGLTLGIAATALLMRRPIP